MRHFGWQWLAASSLLLSLAAGAATRPQYGGTLRVAVREAPTSLDPADATQADSFARRNLMALIFETLVTIDDRGRVHPALAEAWETAPGDQRWQFRLRPGIRFHDGSPLTAELAASSLRAANPSWNVMAEMDSVVIQCGAPDTNLPAELAQARNAIVKRNGSGKPSGTGPFHIEDWQPGKKLTLGAEESYWRGRAFLDSIEVELGKNYSSQLITLELGKAQLVEAAPEQTHRASMEGRRIDSSEPMELMALVFSHDVQSPDKKLLRHALALSVDRASIRSVLLQGAGQPAASILPNWMSGYGFVFPADEDLARARHERDQVHALPTWSVGYDSNDPISQVLAERIALNARDAGLTLQPTTSAATADVRVMRVPLASADPWVTLAQVAAITGVDMPKTGGHSVEDLYAAEQAVLATQRVIPLFHLPVSYATSPALKDWLPDGVGDWRLGDVWLGSEKP
ncbi:MAG: ABC transporter substrate-binding protein [Candidatus Sulfotelmatobacter sp.]